MTYSAFSADFLILDTGCSWIVIREAYLVICVRMGLCFSKRYTLFILRRTTENGSAKR